MKKICTKYNSQKIKEQYKKGHINQQETQTSVNIKKHEVNTSKRENTYEI